jgi:uncharacterized protein DUF1176
MTILLVLGFLMQTTMSPVAREPYSERDLLPKSKVTVKERAAWHERLQWPEECEDAFNKTYGSYSNAPGLVDFYHLGGTQYLVEITCWSGAYQPGKVFLFLDEAKPLQGNARPLQFKLYDRDETGQVSSYYDTEMAGLTSFDPKKKRLRVWSKGRGIGDCGSLVTYEIRNGIPVPIAARVQACLDPPRLIDPEKWPKVPKRKL